MTAQRGKPGQPPFTLNWALSAPAAHGCRLVVMTEAEWERWVRMVYAARGLHVFPIPGNDPDDIPTYAIGVH